jgi:ribose/xylose/arabinose/galactoside ABC-type transport system permease subunit
MSVAHSRVVPPRTQHQARRNITRIARDNAAYIALALLIAIFWLLAGNRFMSGQNWSYIAQQVPVLAVLAIAETLVITSGFIDLSVGSVLGLASFAATIGAANFGLPGLLLGLTVGVLTGLINGSIFAFVRIPSFIVTLGTMVILRAVLQIISGGEAIYLSDQSNATSVVATLNVIGQFPGIIIAGGVIWFLAWLLYTKTTFGDDLKAMGGNERVVGLFGVNLNRRRLTTFTIAGFVVGLAAILNLARIGAATPVTGTGMELQAISAVVLGGTPLTGGYGSIAKTVVGATALVVLSNGLTIAGVPPSWNDVVRGLLLIVAIGIALDRRKIGTVK